MNTDRKLDLKEITLEQADQFTVFGQQTLYKVKRKGQLLLASTSKHEIENWLRDHCVVSDALGEVKNLVEATSRAYATRDNRST